MRAFIVCACVCVYIVVFTLLKFAHSAQSLCKYS